MLKKLTNAQSNYSAQQLKHDYDKHKKFSEMISKKSGTFYQKIIAQAMHKKHFSATGEGLDERTAMLIQNILDRRKRRVSRLKPQTANPSLPNLQDNVAKPNTTSYRSNSNAKFQPEEHFPPPRELTGVDHMLI